MKKIILIASTLILALSISSFAEDVDPYQKQLNLLRDDMQKFGITVDVFGESPFQTGTSLSQYYMSEKTLVLEAKTFFQSKANTLSSTDDVADLQFRNKVLRSHANNILLQLSQAIRNRKDEGLAVEAAKQKETLQEIIDGCSKSPDCVARRLDQKETHVQNVMIDNLQASAEIFKQIPYMHAMEVMSAYQLTQMIYLEVFKNQALISKVEFELYNEKQEMLAKQIRKNPTLTEAERKLQIQLANNVINKWKKKILDRRNSKMEFTRLAEKLKTENQKLAKEIQTTRKANSAILGDLYDKKRCRGFLGKRRRNWCKGQEFFQDAIGSTASRVGVFMSSSGLPVEGNDGSQLPESFFKSL